MLLRTPRRFLAANVMRNAMKTTITMVILLLLTNFSDSLFAYSCIDLIINQERIKYSDVVLVRKTLSRQLETLTDTLNKRLKPKTDSLEIFGEPLTNPIYKDGGDIGLRKFIRQNLRYPNGQCIEGKVYVGFTVDTFGNVKNIEIKRGITKETDEEAIRIVKLLTFTCGTILGKPIETKMTLPINFSMKFKNEK